MRSSHSFRRAGVLAGLALVAGALAATPASAYNLTKISEVHFGGAGSFVELQSYAEGQNLVGGHYIRTYGPNGAPSQTFAIPSAVQNGQSQRTILIGNNTVTGADFNSPAIGYDEDGGAVCFLDSLGTPDLGQRDVGIDCVAWGDFDGSFTEGTPSPVGVNVAPGGGLFSDSLTRLSNRGCATALDAADDTDNTISDFVATMGAGTPRNNATAPTETLCQSPGAKKKCKKKKKGKGKAGAAAKKKKKCKKKKKKK